MTDRICEFRQCGRLSDRRCGLCEPHYQQRKRTGTLAPIETNIERLVSMIIRSGDDCVLVDWSPDQSHPVVSGVHGRTETVGAAALIISGRLRPDGMVTLHDPAVCNNGRCANPRHVRWGTPKENMADKKVAGTVPDQMGENHGTSRLTDAQVYEIRALAAVERREPGWLSQEAIGELYGICQVHVSGIHLRKTWSHLPEEQL